MLRSYARNTVITLLILFIPVVAFAAPFIVFEKEIHDFGDVPEGMEAEYSFPFENRGSSELVIDKVSSS